MSGAHLVRCDVCGIPWYRRTLRRRRDGLLACPECASERDPVTLTEGNVAGMPTPAVPRWDGGSNAEEPITFVLVDMDGALVVTDDGDTVNPKE